jgi:hypothetical protein
MMNVTDLPRAVLRLEYQLVRLPLTLVEQRLLARMPDDQPLRLVLERSLGVLDATVGGALGDSDLRRRGVALAERSSVRGRAATLRASASAEREQAEATLKTKLDQAAEDQSDALAAERAAVDNARATEERRERAAEENARKRSAAAKRQADETAARRTESVEAAKRAELDRIGAAEREVAAETAAALKDSRDERAAADAARAKADEVEDLAEAEKRKRQAQRASHTTAADT